MDDNSTPIDAATIAAQTQGPGEYIEIFGLRVRTNLVRRLAFEVANGTRTELHVMFTVDAERRVDVLPALCGDGDSEVICWSGSMDTAPPGPCLCLLVLKEDGGARAGYGWYADERHAWMVIFEGRKPVPVPRQQVVAWAWPPTGPRNKFGGHGCAGATGGPAAKQTGLDDGPLLDPPRKRKVRTKEEAAKIRAKAWETRRAVYGPAGHDKYRKK